MHEAYMAHYKEHIWSSYSEKHLSYSEAQIEQKYVI